MIEFRNIFLQYHYEQYPLFEDLTFQLQEGKNTLLCDMQSGKTSLCKMLLGQLSPNSGSIVVDGVQLYPLQKGVAPPVLSALYLPSNPTFFPNKTVLYNLQYPLRLRKQLAQNAEKIDAVIQQLHLAQLLDVKAKNLTLRQKKLLALARGLTVERDIVLLDGFFDDTESQEELSPQQVLPMFRCKTEVVLTAIPDIALGHTVLLDGKRCVFSGSGSEAAQIVAGLTWLARETQRQK